jgi:hypothetical protein
MGATWLFGQFFTRMVELPKFSKVEAKNLMSFLLGVTKNGSVIGKERGANRGCPPIQPMTVPLIGGLPKDVV